MLASFMLALREGMEGALIVGILLGSLNTLNYGKGRRSVWLGVGTAVIGSIGAGLTLNLVGAAFEGRAEEIFEGIAMLLAAVVLTWVIFWMKNQARDFNNKIKTDVQQAVIHGGGFALFSLAFLSIFREGIELALFLTAIALDQEGSSVWVGAVLGLGAAVILGVLLYRSLIKLNLSRFFQITSLILILFAAGLVAHGVHEFNEVGLIPPIIEHLWDINHILDENSTVGQLLKTLLGYNGNPSLTEVLSYLVYFGVVRLFGFKYRDLFVSTSKNKEVPA
jgi:high-affinity iron transporter